MLNLRGPKCNLLCGNASLNCSHHLQNKRPISRVLNSFSTCPLPVLFDTKLLQQAQFSDIWQVLTGKTINTLLMTVVCDILYLKPRVVSFQIMSITHSIWRPSTLNKTGLTGISYGWARQVCAKRLPKIIWQDETKLLFPTSCPAVPNKKQQRLPRTKPVLSLRTIGEICL